MPARFPPLFVGFRVFRGSDHRRIAAGRFVVAPGAVSIVGRWTRVERVFATDAEATTLALDFRIASDSDVGEMWIDDVSLEPVGCPGRSGP